MLISDGASERRWSRCWRSPCAQKGALTVEEERKRVREEEDGGGGGSCIGFMQGRLNRGGVIYRMETMFHITVKLDC